MIVAWTRVVAVGMERTRQSLEVELTEWGGAGEGKKGVEDEVSSNLGDRGPRGASF